MKTMLIGTNNPGKIKEFCELLADLPIEIVTPNVINLTLEVEETGSTYRENAGLKARAFAEQSGMVAIADDSGLELEALQGAPGIFSARYSRAPGATDADRRRYLLEKLSGVPRPWKARFYCLIAVAQPGGPMYFSEGACPGEIVPEERGSGGFGYDPIFLLPELGLTMAELDGAVKNRFSHRGRAVRAAVPIIQQVLSLADGN
jgi:XTP/dITP diphosphohydrolase